MLSASVPPGLREALAGAAAHFRTPELAAAAERISRGYRSGAPVIPGTRIDATAYAATRMPATFGAILKCFAEVPVRPASILDLGGGTGATAWAACTYWDDPIAVTAVEGNPEMLEMGRALSAPGIVWRGGDIRNLSGLGQHDLAVFGYSLGEMPERDAADSLAQAWNRSNLGVLVVEPGTPAGWTRVLRMRRRLIELGAGIQAPCPHAQDCPLATPDWCHFAVRVERSRLHRQLKGGELGYEDEKFSYVLGLKDGAPARPAEARILRHPIVLKGHIGLELCTQQGLGSLTVVRGQKVQFKAARRASWGGRWSPGERDDEAVEA